MLSSLRFPLFIRSALLTFGVRLRPQEQREPSSAAANAAARRRSTRAIVASLFFGKINHLYSCISSSTSLSFLFSFWGFFTLISLLRRSRKRAGKNWLHCCQNLEIHRSTHYHIPTLQFQDDPSNQSEIQEEIPLQLRMPKFSSS